MSDVDAIALEATHQIENAFAVKRGKGGYVQRRAAVQVIIANTIRALSPPEPTEGPIREHLTQTMLAHLRHMARVRPAGLDRDAAEWAVGEIERRGELGHQAFRLAVHHQERADAAEAAARAMPLQQRTLTREQIKTAVTKAACRKYGTTNPPCPVPSCECYKEGERAADAVLALPSQEGGR